MGAACLSREFSHSFTEDAVARFLSVIRIALDNKVNLQSLTPRLRTRCRVRSSDSMPTKTCISPSRDGYVFQPQQSRHLWGRNADVAHEALIFYPPPEIVFSFVLFATPSTPASRTLLFNTEHRRPTRQDGKFLVIKTLMATARESNA